MSKSLIASWDVRHRPAALPTQIRLGVPPGVIEYRRRHETVMQDDIGVVQGPQRLQGQKFRIARVRRPPARPVPARRAAETAAMSR